METQTSQECPISWEVSSAALATAADLNFVTVWYVKTMEKLEILWSFFEPPLRNGFQRCFVIVEHLQWWVFGWEFHLSEVQSKRWKHGVHLCKAPGTVGKSLHLRWIQCFSRTNMKLANANRSACRDALPIHLRGPSLILPTARAGQRIFVFKPSLSDSKCCQNHSSSGRFHREHFSKAVLLMPFRASPLNDSYGDWSNQYRQESRINPS